MAKYDELFFHPLIVLWFGWVVCEWVSALYSFGIMKPNWVVDFSSHSCRFKRSVYTQPMMTFTPNDMSLPHNGFCLLKSISSFYWIYSFTLIFVSRWKYDETASCELLKLRDTPFSPLLSQSQGAEHCTRKRFSLRINCCCCEFEESTQKETADTHSKHIEWWWKYGKSNN